MKTIIGPTEKLLEIKLEAYISMLQEMSSYRLIAVYKQKSNYPIAYWKQSIQQFYEVMFSETLIEEVRKDFQLTFDKITSLDRKDYTYEEMEEITTSMMRFAAITGISKIPELQSSIKIKGGPQ